MNLLDEAMEKCIILNKSIIEDGYGGYDTVWADGAKFECAVSLDTSTEARIALKQGVTALYTITTSKALNLQYHDVFKRISDGKVFRVTSDGDDVYTPNSATLDMRVVSAEEWALPTSRKAGESSG